MTAQETFTRAYPALASAVRGYLAIRHHAYHQREETAADALGCAWAAWWSMTERGVDPLTVDLGGIARNAVKQALRGGRFAVGRRGANREDIMDCVQRTPVVGRMGGTTSAEGNAIDWDHCSLERFVGSHNDHAAQLDFATWLDSLTSRDRRVAELLAEGGRTKDVALACGMCPGRVSQLRGELEESWERFDAGDDYSGVQAKYRAWTTTRRRAVR